MTKAIKIAMFSGPVYGIDDTFKYIPPVSDDVNAFLAAIKEKADNIHIQTCYSTQTSDDKTDWVVVTVTYELNEFEEWEEQY